MSSSIHESRSHSVESLVLWCIRLVCLPSLAGNLIGLEVVPPLLLIGFHLIHNGSGSEPHLILSCVCGWLLVDSTLLILDLTLGLRIDHHLKIIEKEFWY